MDKITKIIGTTLVCFSLVVVALSLGNTVAASPTQAPNIGDLVFTDTNGDGVQNAGEAGINGVKVDLYKATDLNTIVSTTTTANVGGVDGMYYLYPTTTSDFVLKFTAPAPSAYIWTKMDQGSDDTLDSDVNDTGWTKSFTIASTTTSKLDVDAGLTLPSCIGQYVYEDKNGDGTFNTGDAGIPSAVVSLVAVDGTTTTTMSDSTGTGKYSFCNLQKGTYTVKIDRDQTAVKNYANFSYGYDNTTAQTYTLTIGTNGYDKTANFGYIAYGKIGSTVWTDTNKDCKIDATEKGIPSVKVWLKDATGTVVASTMTNANGNYWFLARSNVAYTVVLDADWVSANATNYGTATCGTSKTLAVLGSHEAYLTNDFGFTGKVLANTGSDMYLTIAAGLTMLALGYGVSRKFKKSVV